MRGRKTVLGKLVHEGWGGKWQDVSEPRMGRTTRRAGGKR